MTNVTMLAASEGAVNGGPAGLPTVIRTTRPFQLQKAG